MGLGYSSEFWINGVLLSSVVTMGITGNLSCNLVLLSKKLRLNQTFLSLLRWLAVIDSIFLGFVFLTFCLPQLSEYYRTWLYPYMMPTLLPLTSIFLNVSIYCVISLAVERYLSVCRPQHMDKGSFGGYILPIFAFSVFFNLPKFFELKIDFVKEKNDDSFSIPYVLPTLLRKSPEYSYYTIGAVFIFLGLIPLCSVSVLNYLVVRRMKKLGGDDSHLATFRDRTSTYLLSGVVIIMIICHLPRNILNVYEMYLAATSAELNFPHPWLVDLSHITLALCSSLNIFIFSCQDKIFREILLGKIFFCQKKGENWQNTSLDINFNSQGVVTGTAVEANEIVELLA
ncbi:FMRFamide receptor [Eurytemora carolleeae]|uniref:FMRFamide receptor n=1 Tax=Eurytemora carolleeae TaxID=1294199 RepID=UPI000C77C887|nr:FMRFamide receptor [Eurytemora carolleeae]|eukprot:XP_023332699.1 FMRFamide receptor-like [Eurytemora affinis]